MSTGKRVLDLVGEIYDCAIEPAGWPNVLAQVGARVRADCAAINLVDPVQLQVTFATHWNVKPEVMAAFGTRQDINPVMSAGWFMEVDEPYTTASYMGEKEYRSSRFYKELTAPLGFDDAIMSVVAKSATRYGSLTFPVRAGDGPLTAADLAEIRTFAPHIRRAVMISDLLEARALKGDMLSAAVDLLAVGIVLVDGRKRIVHANRAALTRLEERKSIRRDGDELSARDAKSARDLSDAISIAASGSTVQIPASGISIPIIGDGGGDLAAWVLPLDGGLRDQLLAPYAARVAVFLRAIGDVSPLPGELFVRRYGITPAECRVLMMLTQGMTSRAVAQTLGISETTYKTHLQRLFVKTATKRQVGLVRLAMSALAPASR